NPRVARGAGPQRRQGKSFRNVSETPAPCLRAFALGDWPPTTPPHAVEKRGHLRFAGIISCVLVCICANVSLQIVPRGRADSMTWVTRRHALMATLVSGLLFFN